MWLWGSTWFRVVWQRKLGKADTSVHKIGVCHQPITGLHKYLGCNSSPYTCCHISKSAQLCGGSASTAAQRAVNGKTTSPVCHCSRLLIVLKLRALMSTLIVHSQTLWLSNGQPIQEVWAESCRSLTLHL